MGWFRKKPKSEDHLAIAKRKPRLRKRPYKRRKHRSKARWRKGQVPLLMPFWRNYPPKCNTASLSGKYAGDKASQTAEAAMNVVGTAQEMEEVGARAVHNKAVSTEMSEKEVAEEIHDRAAEALESAKDKTCEKVGVAGDTIHDATGYVKEKLREIVVGAVHEVYDVGQAAKERTSGVAEYAKDKVYKGVQGVHKTRDAVFGSVLSGVDKTTNTATDAAEKVKITAEHAAQEVREAGRGI
nr:late embryogenesis abundant protein 76-like [Physcomitrium patens]|eukprot:XP_024396029.1 late embryogenesis abundant protein 76-like [Physcomitrella patens]